MKPGTLASHTGIPRSTIYSIIKRNSKSVELSVIERICDVLHVPVEYFYDKPSSGNVVQFTPETQKAAPSLSNEAVDIAKRYSALDWHGKTVVNVVLTEEKKRKRSRKYEAYDEEGESTGRVIPLYFTPAAAGYASPAFGDDFDYIEVGGDVPAHAEYALKIDGDSMEPDIMDGSTVYVNRDPLRNGDAGSSSSTGTCSASSITGTSGAT